MISVEKEHRPDKDAVVVPRAVEAVRRRGRGSVSNASGRYEPLARALIDDGWDSLAELPPFAAQALLRAEAELRHVVEELPAAGVEETSAEDGHQLEGVQVPDRAMQQEDVDDLLASLGF